MQSSCCQYLTPSSCAFYWGPRCYERMPLPNRNQKYQQHKRELAHQGCKAFKKQHNTLLPVWQEHFLSGTFFCCGKVTSDFIILRHHAGWRTKGDPTLQWHSDQTLGQEEPSQMFADTTSYTGDGWYQQHKAISVGLLEKLHLRNCSEGHNIAPETSLRCVACALSHLFYF